MWRKQYRAGVEGFSAPASTANGHSRRFAIAPLDVRASVGVRHRRRRCRRRSSWSSDAESFRISARFDPGLVVAVCLVLFVVVKAMPRDDSHSIRPGGWWMRGPHRIAARHERLAAGAGAAGP